MKEFHGLKRNIYGYQIKNIFLKNGDIIFFDWIDENTGKQDGLAEHVGIVEKCSDSIVYTIEGNTNNNSCSRKRYNINDKTIFGYGTPKYVE